MKKTLRHGPVETIRIPATGFEGYLCRPTNFNVGVQDPDYVAWATDRLKKLPEMASQFALQAKAEHEFADPASYTPPQSTGQARGLALGIGPQQAFIGEAILPRFVGGHSDQVLYYPKYGRERFFVDAEGHKVGLGGTVKRLDVKLEFGTVSTSPVAVEVATEEREETLAQSVLNMGIHAYKLDTAQQALATEKEAALAAFVLDTGNYASGFSESLTSTNQWTHKDSTPVQAVWAAKRKVFKKTFSPPDVFALGGDSEAALMVNAQILSLASAARTGTGRASVPVTRDFLAAVFQMPIVVGDAAQIVTLDNAADPTLIWGDFAGVYCTGGGAIAAPRFGLNVSADGYPSLYPYRDDRVGTKYANVFKWADCWAPQGISNTAGYLWLDTNA